MTTPASPSAPASRLAPDLQRRPLAVPALVLWVQGSGEALSKAEVATSPLFFASADPEGETGLPAGSVVVGLDGLLHGVGASGTPSSQVAELRRRVADGLVAQSQLAAIVADITDHRNAQVNLVGALVPRLESHVVSRDQLTALLADIASLRTQLTAVVADAVTQKGILDGVVGVVPAALTAVAPAAATATTTVGVGGGTTAGYARLRSDAEFTIQGKHYRKASTDDLWDLSGETDTDGATWRAYWLYLSTSGVASLGVGSDQPSSEIAILGLPACDPELSVIGYYIAAPSTDFDGVAGLAAQGTFGDGFPAALGWGIGGVATTTQTGLADGTTAGRIKTLADVEFTVDGEHYYKGATDDLWNLAAQTDTDGSSYRAYWLYLNSAGVASIGAGADAASSDLAVAALPTPADDKAVIGYYIAGPSTDFNGVAGLDSYGAYHMGWPATAF